MGLQLSGQRDRPLKLGKRVGRPQLSILLFLAVLFIYLVLPTSDYYWDGISFAQQIEYSQSLSSRSLSE